MSTIALQKNEETKSDPSIEEKYPAHEAAAGVPEEPSVKTTKIQSDSHPPTYCLVQISDDSDAGTPSKEDEDEFNAMWDLVIALEGLGFGNPEQVREKPKFTTMECMADGYALKTEFEKALNSSKAAIDAIIVSLRSEGVSQRGGGTSTDDGESPEGGSASASPGEIRGHATSYWTCCHCSASNDADGDTTCSSCSHDFCSNCSLS